MLKTNPLTIRDYLDRLSGLPQRNLPASVPLVGETVGSGRFKSVLADLLQSEKGKGADPPGKTIADYRLNPVQSQAYAGRRKTPVAGDGAVLAVAPPPNGIDRVGIADPQVDIAAGFAVPNQEVSAVGGAASGRRETSGCDGARQIIDRSILQAAEKYDLPPALIRGVVRAESNYRVKAVSPAGAQGLMQLMPATAQELGVDDPFDIAQNIDGGTRYLRQMLDLFDGDVRHALAAYNAGPGTVKRYNGIPPYPETTHYVKRVMRFSGANA